MRDKFYIFLSDMNYLASMKIMLPTPLMTDIGLVQAPWPPGVLWGLILPTTEWTSKTRDLTSASAPPRHSPRRRDDHGNPPP